MPPMKHCRKIPQSQSAVAKYHINHLPTLLPHICLLEQNRKKNLNFLFCFLLLFVVSFFAFVPLDKRLFNSYLSQCTIYLNKIGGKKSKLFILFFIQWNIVDPPMIRSQHGIIAPFLLFERRRRRHLLSRNDRSVRSQLRKKNKIGKKYQRVRYVDYQTKLFNLFVNIEMKELVEIK